MLKSIAFFHAEVKAKTFMVAIFVEVNLLPSREAFEHNPALEVRAVSIN
jgi:hypothetical protein